jgi:outer membrane protein TolC
LRVPSIGSTRPRRAAAILFACLAGTAAAAQPAAPPGSPAPSGVRQLSLEDAISLGLENNLRVLLGEAEAAAARARELEAQAHLWPSFDLAATRSRQVINLEAFGITPAPGEPSLVGPFDLVDLRASASGPLLDFSAFDAEHAASSRAAAARASLAESRDLVVLATGNLYLRALAEQGRVEAAEADFRTAESFDRLARDRHDAGSASALDLLRADAALEAARARRTDARTAAEKSKLLLARTVGLPGGQPLELTGKLTFAPLPALAVDQLVATADASRADLQAARAELDAARFALDAARETRWPSLVASGDIGKIGPTAGRSEKTWTLGAGLRVPILHGGALTARIAAARADEIAQQARVGDLQREVDFDVRAALLDLESASDQVTTATTARDLAEKELVVARDRFAAGLADSLDVVTAQQAVAAAHESYLAALYGHNAAKAGLARALGLAEEAFASILEGKIDDLRPANRTERR